MTEKHRKNQEVKGKRTLSQSYFKIVRVPLIELVDLSCSELKLYIHLIDLADQYKQVSEDELSEDDWCWKPFNFYEVIGMGRSAFHRAISGLKKRGLVETTRCILISGRGDGTHVILGGTPNGRVEVAKKNCSSLSGQEKVVRDRLKSQLGGLTEVATPAGRVDLLTETEIIEVKAIKDWKSALGQVLVYSAFYPEHQKRLHLFGTARELETLFSIEAAVVGFGVKVTGEEV